MWFLHGAGWLNCSPTICKHGLSQNAHISVSSRCSRSRSTCMPVPPIGRGAGRRSGFQESFRHCAWSQSVTPKGWKTEAIMLVAWPSAHILVVSWRLDRAFCSYTVKSVYLSVLCCFVLISGTLCLLVSIMVDFCCLLVFVCVKIVCFSSSYSKTSI